MGLHPPPWDALVSEIEELAGRVVVERRISRADLATVTGELGLTSEETAIAERLILSYVAGSAREERRRRDKKAADAKAGRR